MRREQYGADLGLARSALRVLNGIAACDTRPRRDMRYRNRKGGNAMEGFTSEIMRRRP
jgi:hypothetical protein